MAQKFAGHYRNFKKYASARVPYIFNGAWNDVMGV